MKLLSKNPSILLVMLALLAASPGPRATGQPLRWDAWHSLPGVFDLSGPGRDGRLLAAAGGKLVWVSPAGAVSPFAQGPQGYSAAAGAESYVAVSSGEAVSSAGCVFGNDEVYALELSGPPGVARVDPQGGSSLFVRVPGVETLNGIAFDRTGRFGHRLLVTGPNHGHSVVAAVDCKGGLTVITSSAPVLEGGLAVAPAQFGSYGGDLVAPDELSGHLVAIGADGSSRILADSGLPTGPDIGIESLGFVPAGFAAGGKAYLADRLTANNPHPGTDTILRLDARDLLQRGLQEGDLLVSTEGAGLTIAVHCTASCSVTHLAEASSVAHIEGHLLLVAERPLAPPGLQEVRDLGAGERRSQVIRAGGIAAGAAALTVAALAFLRSRRRRRARS